MKLPQLLIELHKSSQSLYLPAHGRGQALPNDFRSLFNCRAGVWDLPELEEIGGPLERNGAIAKSQENSAKKIGVKKGWYGVNGATGCLQAALLAAARPGKGVLMPRNVHKSLIGACVLGDLFPIFFDLPYLEDRGHYSSPNAKWLEEVLNQVQTTGIEIDAAVLIHPTYHGYTCNIKPLVNLLHEKGWPVIVDEAHGTHFAFNIHPELPKSSIEAGADLVVHSLHKSAQGLSQTAALWLQGDRIDPKTIEKTIACLQTTSTNALLLASCESAIEELSNPKTRKRLRKRVTEGKQIYEKLVSQGIPLLKTQDPLRLILNTSHVGINGIEADKWFTKHGLLAELPEPGCLTFCLGWAPQKGLARIFAKRWKELITTQKKWGRLKPFRPIPTSIITMPSMSPRIAFQASSKKVLIEESIGEISAELISPYPPGIPLIFPGEFINEKKAEWLIEQRFNWPNKIPDGISVISKFG